MNRYNLTFDDACDIANNAIEDGFMKIETYDRKKGKLLAWLTGIANNAAINKHKRRISVETVALGFDPSAVGPEDYQHQSQAENTQLKFEFHARIQSLPEKDRRMVELLLQQYKMKEIAEIMQISYDDVRQSKKRLYKKIREILKSSSLFMKIYFRNKNKEGK